MSIGKIEIRCPGKRGHKVSNGDYQTEYTTCGSLLGGIGDKSDAIFRCPICKRFWDVFFEEDGTLVVKGIEKGSRIEMEKSVRRVEDVADDDE